MTLNPNVPQPSNGNEPSHDHLPQQDNPCFLVSACKSTAADIYKDHIMEIPATTVLPEAVQLQGGDRVSLTGFHFKANPPRYRHVQM